MTRLLLLLWRFFTHRWTRYVAAWAAVLGLAAYAHDKAVHVFDERATETEKQRRDGNAGHTGIDFGGQWLMGRMLVLGHGRQLYDRHRLYEVAWQAYPAEREALAPEKHDADEMLSAFMDTESEKGGRSEREKQERETIQSLTLPLAAQDPLQAAAVVTAAKEKYWTPERLEPLQKKHVGGPLYPPTQALIFAPLALGDHPQSAYFITQWIMLLSGFIAGLGVTVLTRGRIWWPVASAMIMLYPGFTGGHELGQNAPASLAILVWGWALTARGYETAGGAVWGLLAYKPVWAAAFFLVPLLSRRWRACIGMAAVGVAMIAATLPFVGIEAWKDWLKIGEMANRTYSVDPNWIPLSRDLLGLVRRYVVDLSNDWEYFERDVWYAHVAGWALWLIIVETTVRLSQLYFDRVRAATGPAAGFLLLAAWLSCFHFMYYDSLLSALGFLVLIHAPGELFRPKLVTLVAPQGGPGLDTHAVDYFRPRLAETHPGLSGTGTGWTWVANSFLIYFGAALLIVQHTMPYLQIGVTATARRFPTYTTSGTRETRVREESEWVEIPLFDMIELRRNSVLRFHDGRTETPRLVVGTATHGPPWETYLLLGLWAWCGARLVLGAGRHDTPGNSG